MIYKQITRCRICGDKKLTDVLDLGTQYLTGVFPKQNEKVAKGPLHLVQCCNCDLLQLKHNYNMRILYGNNYGYRSSLNKSMILHLEKIVGKIEKIIKLKSKDLVIDIGSNDGTLLKSYQNQNLNLVGIDPAKKFKKYYPKHIKYITDFFSKRYFTDKAKVVTSIAMFYDLENPTEFMQNIYDILDNEGIWVTEQMYMPQMVKNVSYDTICHEHLEYYAFKQLKLMADRVGFKVIDIDFNDINGASFAVTFAKRDSKYNELKINKKENVNLKKFTCEVKKHRKNLLDLLKKLEGKTVLGYGASTKGNVILQYCGLTPKDIPYIAEVNQEKYGKVTPGTHIPIISEEKARKMKPDYYLVLPWHFKKFIIEREKEFLKSGGHLIFPLPKIEIV